MIEAELYDGEWIEEEEDLSRQQHPMDTYYADKAQDWWEKGYWNY
jgi:hypothetical protein